MKLINILTLTLVVFLWGSSFTVIKLGLEEIPPITLALLRFLFAIPILLVFTYSKHRSILNKDIIEDWRYFLILGLTGVTFCHIFQNFGLKFTTASHSSLIISSNPIFIALLSHIYLKERVTWKSVVGILLAFTGILFIIGPQEWSFSQTRLLGDILSIGAGLSWASYTVLGRKVLYKYEANQVTTLTMMVGIVFLLPTVFYFEKPVLPSSAWIWFLLLFLSLLCSGLSYLLWSKALEEVSASKAGVFLFFIPIASVSIAFIVLMEELGPLLLVGALLVTIGVAITGRQ